MADAGSVLSAVDMGTNSFHLVVARTTTDRRFEILASEKEMVRLGSGSGDMKLLSGPAIDRAVACLQRFQQVARIHGAELVAVATSAVREAENRNALLDRCRRELGIEIEVVSGVEEARLIHLGVLQALAVYDDQLVLIDIGGGSTEMVLGKGEEMAWGRSLKLGAIRLSDRFFPGGSISAKRVRRCRDYVRSFAAPSVAELTGHGFDLGVGSSGTIENLAQVAAELDGDPPRRLNGYRLTVSALDRAVDAILAAPTAEARREVPGVDPHRADILPAGAILAQTLVHDLGLEELTISTYALREGILLDLLRRRDERGLHHLSQLRRSSVRHLVQRFEEYPVHAEWSTELTLQLFDGTRSLHGLPERALDVLEAAGLLANIGRAIAHESHHKHSYYLIRNTEQLTGFTSHEIELIAQVARYHRKSSPKPKHPEFAALGDDDQRLVRILAGLLRLGIGLDRGQRQAVGEVSCHLDSDSGRLNILAGARPDTDTSLELYTAAARKELAAEALGLPIEIVPA